LVKLILEILQFALVKKKSEHLPILILFEIFLALILNNFIYFFLLFIILVNLLYIAISYITYKEINFEYHIQN
jgi:hypothetical protein